MVRFQTLTLTALVTLAALGATAAAQGPGSGGPRGGGPRGGGPGFGLRGPDGGLPLRQLNLTDAQREQVRQLMQQHREQSRGLFERVEAARDGQRRAMEAIPFSEQQIRTAMQTLAEVQTELAVQQARLQSDIYALLTPEQQEQLKKVRSEREARMKQRRERFERRVPRPQA